MEACFAPQSIFFLQGLVPLVTMLPPLFLLDDPVVDGYKGRWRRGGGGSSSSSSSSSSSRQVRGLSLGSIDGDRGHSAQRSLANDNDHSHSHSNNTSSVSAAAKAKLWQVWDCVQMNHIWMPMSFIFVFAATPSNADAFANFILGPLCFSDAMYTYLLAIGMAASLLGTFIYKRYLRAVPFRKLFCVTLIIAAAFSASQLFLITRLNKAMGIPDFLFALGDEVIVDTASFIVQMPTLVMCASLCPKGVESTLYALMTVVNNIALSVGGSFSAALADAFGITLANFDNLWALTLLTSLSTLIPVLLIPLVPEGVEACEDSATAIEAAGEGGGGGGGGEEEEEVGIEEADGDGSGGSRGSGGAAAAAAQAIPRSKYGGGGFVTVLVVGLMYSIVNAGIKLSATDAVAPAPSLSIMSTSPSPGASNNGSADVFEWQCQKEVVNACGVDVDGEDDDEGAGKGPDERR
jgi:uncharacterized membrane protein YgcG